MSDMICDSGKRAQVESGISQHVSWLHHMMRKGGFENYIWCPNRVLGQATKFKQFSMDLIFCRLTTLRVDLVHQQLRESSNTLPVREGTTIFLDLVDPP
jgi:hypothetical protein